MALCQYCQRPAGWMKNAHPECIDTRRQGAVAALRKFQQALDRNVDVQTFCRMVRDMARASYLSEGEVQQLAVSGIADTLDRGLSDHVLNEFESGRIIDLIHGFDLKDQDLGDVPAKIGKAVTLREIDAGRMTEVASLGNGNLPVKFRSGEGLLWAFANAEYYQARSKTAYLGASQGMSVRVAKGVYYRIGSARGEAIRTDYLAHQANGALIISNRAIYFLSVNKTVTLAAEKIIAVQLYADAVQISRDGVNTAPFIFRVDDPSFAANLLVRIVKG